MMWLAVIHIFLRSTFLVAGTKELNSFHSSRLPFGICRSFYNHLLLARLFDMRSVLPPMRYRAFFYITVYYHVLQFQNIRGNLQTGSASGVAGRAGADSDVIYNYIGL